MLILAVDTSARMGSAAVLRDSQVLGEISGYEETPYSTRLFRDVALLQARAKCRLNEVDVFAVASGPGSFTGLRVGLTAVKAWAEVYGKPIAAVSGLEAVAAEFFLQGAPVASNGHTVAPFLDARRGQVFGGIYRRVSGEGMMLALSGTEAIVSPEEFIEWVRAESSEPAVLVSPTPEVLPAPKVKEVLGGVRVERVPAALAPAIGRLGYARALRGDLLDPLGLDANYVRRSDAEVAWKDK